MYKSKKTRLIVGPANSIGGKTSEARRGKKTCAKECQRRNDRVGERRYIEKIHLL